MEENFNYSSTLLINVSTSLIFFTAVALYFLLFVIKDDSFVPIRIPIIAPTILAAALGIIHGLITGLLIAWRKSDSTISTLISSILAMEIISLIIFLCVWLIDRTSNSDIPNPQELNLINYFITNIQLFLRISLYLLIPAFLIGFANRLFLFFYR